MKGLKNRAIEVLIKLSRMVGLVKPRKPNVPPSRFLIVSTTGIGDTLWGIPAIKALKENYPEGYICVLTSARGAELLRGNPDVEEIFVFRRGFRVSLLSLLRRLRQERFDMALIFHTSDRIILPMVFFTGTGQIIGISGQNKGLDFILTKAIPQEDVHGVDMRLKVIREAGVPYREGLHLVLYLSEEERKRASDFLRGLGFDDNSLIVGLQPGAQRPYKCWPAERFIETGTRLVRDFGSRIIVTGSHDEKTLCEHISSRIKGATSIAGRMGLRETAAIIERMQLFITNDTGPMHIAYAVGTPTIALFCPTEPGLCGPYNVKDAVIIKKPMTCNPCVGKRCQKPYCMEQITVEEVIERAQSLLKKDEI